MSWRPALNSGENTQAFYTDAHYTNAHQHTRNVHMLLHIFYSMAFHKKSILMLYITCIIYKVLMHALHIYCMHLPPEPHANKDELSGISPEEAVPPQNVFKLSLPLCIILE